jgi:hypothetical protein
MSFEAAALSMCVGQPLSRQLPKMISQQQKVLGVSEEVVYAGRVLVFVLSSLRNVSEFPFGKVERRAGTAG